MKELKIYKIVGKYRTPLKKGVSIEDIDKYLNYNDVKHWFYVKDFINNWFYIAIYDSLIVGYYFRNEKKGGRIEVLPDFRKNGKYGHLNVYKNLLIRLSNKFPKKFISTVCLLNVPSLSTHFKNGFDIDGINYYENKKKHFMSDLISKKVLGKEFIKKATEEKNEKINLYYEYNDKCYRYNSEKHYKEIRNMFINHNRELKCFIVFKYKIVYLEKKENKFIFPDKFKYYYNLYDIKYRLKIPKKSFFKKKKEEIKEKILSEIQKTLMLI